MTAETLITDEIRRLVGLESEPAVVHVDKTMIERFVDAVDDHNPLWRDEDYARKSGAGGIVAPPSILNTAIFSGNQAWLKFSSILPPRGLDGGGEVEVSQPIRLGDTITISNKVAEITERPSRLGPMLMLTTETTWRNQRAELVARGLSTVLCY